MPFYKGLLYCLTELQQREIKYPAISRYKASKDHLSTSLGVVQKIGGQ